MTEGAGSGGDKVLRTIADIDCRAILASVADTPQTVSELVDQCEISTATAYRKIDELVEVGLLEECTRISPSGRNPSEYRLRTQTVQIDITETGRLNVTCSVAPRLENAPRNESGLIETLPAPYEREAPADAADCWRHAVSAEMAGDELLGEREKCLETPENER